jgi:hypothetical protein
MIIRVECTIIEDDETFVLELEGPDKDVSELEEMVIESLGFTAEEVRLKITEVPGTLH